MTALLLSSSFKTFSQAQPAEITVSPKEELLKKSKSQKTAAFILLGVGTATFFIAGAQSASNILEKTSSSDAIAVVGLGAMVGSIPLFIAAKRNKNKALKLSTFLQLNQNELFVKSIINKIYYPAVGIKLNF